MKTAIKLSLLTLTMVSTTTVMASNINKIVGQITSKITHKIGNFESRISDKEGAIYRDLYPYFMDGCAAGQKVHLDGSRGSALGHGALFIRGACIDKNASFPQVTTECLPGEDEIGVSANGQFMNINWVAVPGEAMFFNGDIKPGTVLDQDYVKNYVKKVYETGLFDNIVAKNTKTKKVLSADTREKVLELIGLESLTLDYALTWGRQTVCQRVPMSKDQISKVVQFLNETNHHYYVEGNEYNWDMFKNSCGHLAQNAFAAAGIMDHKTPDSQGLAATQNVVIPSNFFMNLALATSGEKFPSVRDIFKDQIKRKSLMENSMIAEQAGALTRYHPVYGHDNQSLNLMHNATESATGILNINPFGGMRRKINRQFTVEANIDLKKNLEGYVGIYQNALEEAQKIKPSKDKEFNEVKGQYIQVVSKQLELTKMRLARLRELSQ